MSSQSAKEKPILIGYAQELDGYSYADDGVPVERKPLRPGEVWISYDSIPPTPPTPSAWPGTAGAFTVGVLNEPLVATGDPLQFTTSPSNRMSLILPGNLQNAAYRPTLRDAAGRIIPYNPSVWVADGIERLVAFKVNTPTELGWTLPLNLTYWIYTGSTAGSGGGSSLTLTNEGAGTGLVYDTTASDVAYFRTLEADAGAAGISVTTAADVVRIGNTLTGANLGAGAALFAAKSGATLQMRSLVAGSGVAVTQNANDVTISAAGGVVNIANEGGGAGVFDAIVGTTANLRSLVGTANGVTVTQGATTITVDNTLTGANLGAGTGTMFAAKSGANLQFNSLAGTANGLTVSAPAGGVVTVDNTLTGANLGAGAALFAAKSGASLQMRSLVAGAGSGVTVTQNANDVTIGAAAGSVVDIANEGGGAGVFDAVVGTTANLRSLVGTANGATVTQGATTITVDNTLTGANLGAGTGTMFAAKSGASLQFNSLAGTANGLTVSAPAGGVVTVDNTLTGANLGAGAAIFSAKSGASLQMRSIASGTNITATQSTNLVTLDTNFTTWRITDEKASGTAGGASAAGVQTRTLNTLVSHGSSGSKITLAANILTVTAGRYAVWGSVSNRGGDGHRGYLMNNTSGSVIIRGQSVFNSGATATTPSEFFGTLEPASTANYVVSHYITTARAADGLGAAVGQPGQVEVYTFLYIVLLA
ncbi:MAG: hypothetical protein WC700_04290 [Gemmatimonadaceae bacterium]|jgi:hypothetical protein